MNNKHNQNIGKIGEETACKFLMKRGYQIVLRNYWKKWGEIDIIAKKDQIIYFVEVKTVSKDLTSVGVSGNFVSHENNKYVNHETSDSYRPEDNIHPWKLKRLSRAIQTYLIENNMSEDDKWQFDAITVFLDIKNKTAKADHIKDIIL
ncbi:MAG: hypothetical protein HW401_118 [Parcubacteria group bacterium]|nr:hypothetical protein [Parcubacteria group bacterium]